MLRVLIAALASAALARADIAEQEARFHKLPPGIEVSPPHAIEGMALALGKTNALGFAEQITTPDAPGFEKALRLVTRKVPEKPWSFQTSAKCAVAIARGDVMLATFHARAAGASEEAESAFILEQPSPPYGKSANFRFECGREWQRFFVPFVAAQDYAAGEAVLHFHGGYARQVIEIGGLQVINYKRAAGIGDLPYTPITYKGRGADAAWRRDADVMIERNRKAPMFITVRNAKGKLMPWTEVRIRQQRHAYGFGSAVAAEHLLGSGDDADMYRDVVARNFNRVTLENDLKWPEWESNRQRALDAVTWLREAGLAVRGHTLLWPGWNRLPPDVETLKSKPAELRKRVLDHVRDEATALKGQLAAWDVVNEPVTNTDVQAALGDGILADVFRAAHEADPAARLFINDHSILETGGVDVEHQDAYFRIIKSLLDARAPLHAIGMQAHFNEQLTPPARLGEILDRFATLKLPIEVTEFDINVWDEAVMADYTRDFMTAVFAHPATTGIVMWGFWEKRHWIPNAAHWAGDWRLRASGRVWFDLVFKKWWTSANTITNGKGVAKTKGFLGDYVIEARHGSKTKAVPVKLTKAGAWLTITLP